MVQMPSLFPSSKAEERECTSARFLASSILLFGSTLAFLLETLQALDFYNSGMYHNFS